MMVSLVIVTLIFASVYRCMQGTLGRSITVKMLSKVGQSIMYH
jgi:hypothetical protein